MDKYEIIRIVGRGAFGTAYLARRNTDGKEVILKKIQMDQMTTGDRQSILTEIKVLAMLHHPNVIEYFENFLQDKAMMIVMEYAAGGTLYDLYDWRERKKEGRHLVEDQLNQIMLAMYYEHQNQNLQNFHL